MSTATPSKKYASLEYIGARMEILDCLTRALRGIDRFDRDLFLSCFHPDAVIDSGGNVNAAAKVFDAAATQHKTDQSSTIHNLLNHTCDIDGDVAHTETYLLFTGVNNDKSNWIAGGRYLDRLEHRGGEWRIAFRYTLIEWSGIITSASNPAYDNVPDLFTNGTPSRTKNDPSYRRPLTNRRETKIIADPGALGAPTKA